MARPEVWLHTNRRVLLLSALIPLAALLLGAALLASSARTAAVAGGLLLAAALGLLGGVWRELRRPRLAYLEGDLCVYLGRRGPVRVPIANVECFFAGQFPSRLLFGREVRSAAVVVRLADAARAWRAVAVNPRLGRWADGYITICGTWTEPINTALLEQLNEKLKAAHRAARGRETDA